MSEKQETTADIIAEMRKTKYGDAECEVKWCLTQWADRLEAANKRERGDCAKLRDALVKARSAICHFARYQCKSLSWENCNIQANCGDILCSWRGLCDAKTAINAALSAPPRNCDVGTAEEQYKRFKKFCFDNIGDGIKESRCSKCPLYGTKSKCDFDWLQLHYEEGGAK